MPLSMLINDKQISLFSDNAVLSNFQSGKLGKPSAISDNAFFFDEIIYQ
jgi:hypothetical protein